MPSSLTCLSDEELLAIAAGEEPSSELRDHLDRCPECSERLRRCKAEVAELRRASPIAAASGPGAAAATTDPATADSRPVRLETTELRVSGDSTEFEPPSSDADDTTDGPTDSRDEPPLPPAIGKYLVIGRFPRTGQAEVFRVVHPGLAKDLVLKLSLAPIEPGVRHEIVEEGRITAALKHPHLVQVHDLDFHEDRPYLVMEYVRGRTLEQVAEEGNLPPSRAAALLLKVAGAVDYAHRQGITHRDIKPRNILVDEAGEPRLIDFGMARMRHAWSDDPGRPGGTFAFMAPEQARVESPTEQEKVGPRSDVFALGAVLYYLLTGKPPFAGSTMGECWDRARRCDFDRRALDAPAIPSHLRRICLKAMAEDPADRYNSMEAFRRALTGFLRKPVLLAVGTAFLLAAAIIARVGAGAGDPTWQPTIEVLRGDEILGDLASALPLHTGDQLRVRCTVPAGYRVSAFWYDSDGRLAELGPLSITRGWRADQVLYPRPDPGRDVVPLKGAPGTELLLICARPRGEPAEDEVRPLFTGLGRLPGLGPRTYLLFDGQSVQAKGARGLGAPEPSRTGDAHARLDSVQRKLRERFDFVAGLAIPHADAGQEPASQDSRSTRPLPAASDPSDRK
jgi:hypothetical protein